MALPNKHKFKKDATFGSVVFAPCYPFFFCGGSATIMPDYSSAIGCVDGH
jgi:hypothetical protein